MLRVYAKSWSIFQDKFTQNSWLLFRENNILILTVVRLRLWYFMINKNVSLFILNKADSLTEDRVIRVVTLIMIIGKKSCIIFINFMIIWVYFICYQIKWENWVSETLWRVCNHENRHWYNSYFYAAISSCNFFLKFFRFPY